LLLLLLLLLMLMLMLRLLLPRLSSSARRWCFSTEGVTRRVVP
jgi:hypothetical protein